MNIGISTGLGLLIACMVGAIVTGHVGWVIAAIVLVVVTKLADMVD